MFCITIEDRSYVGGGGIDGLENPTASTDKDSSLLDGNESVVAV